MKNIGKDSGNPGMDRLERILDKVNHFVEWICAGLMIVLTAEALYVMVMRYYFNNTPSWGEVISRFLMVYACMLGYSICVHDETLIRINAFDRYLPERVLNVLEWFYSVCLILFSVFIIVEGTQFTLLCRRNIISGLNIRSSWEMVCIPAGGVFCLLQALRRIMIRHLLPMRRRTGDPNDELTAGILSKEQGTEGGEI